MLWSSCCCLQLCTWLAACFWGKGWAPLALGVTQNQRCWSQWALALGPGICSLSQPFWSPGVKHSQTPLAFPHTYLNFLYNIWCQEIIVAVSWFLMDLNRVKKPFSHFTKNMWKRINLHLVKFYFKKLRPWSNHNEVSGMLSTDSVGLGYGPKTLFSVTRTVRNVSNIRNFLFIFFL